MNKRHTADGLKLLSILFHLVLGIVLMSWGGEEVNYIIGALMWILGITTVVSHIDRLIALIKKYLK